MDRFGVPTSVEALFVDEIQAVMFELEGTDENVLSIVFDAYALRVAPFLSARTPLGRDIFTHHLKWPLLTQAM